MSLNPLPRARGTVMPQCHARRSIGDYINLYNQRRPHSSLEDRTPDEAYFATLPAIKLAA
ncbi:MULTISPECIES: integrase core domain-containing protein [Paraburkholderia]|uniref:integrase core domain-containing protein n=1 Tax=Paraburkholderia TaxID=1822464 RepID=UPI00093728E3